MKGGKKVREIEAFSNFGLNFTNEQSRRVIIMCLLLLILQVKKGETKPPKLKTEDPNKSYVQRPVKRG